ncbi:hypothetical protein FAZ19_23560 [Sphingobacterium alkalisoli]|uniref:Uncharacterized protein n=1 Tax=Sphingobacterium alkalisoli TaxID=1874115 RepID=A0A4U0GM25_9SPHI|nr:hypothetical protein [Sphingobacterium alkalisoli]TJY59717.1 hypothetical protein FAZ19_23560 [Sphingobacterium alkalisoli]GGH33027.1 hypothetical protein GCM10011418_46950 [Sphingobacterium alkalisoli]
MRIWCILFLFVSIFSCGRHLDDATLSKMLEGEDKQQIIEATRYVVDHKKVELVGALLKNGLDPRITHDLRYKGMTIYQIKMHAVQKLMEVPPPKKIDSEPDSVVFNFYLRLARNKKLI